MELTRAFQDAAQSFLQCSSLSSDAAFSTQYFAYAFVTGSLAVILFLHAAVNETYTYGALRQLSRLGKDTKEAVPPAAHIHYTALCRSRACLLAIIFLSSTAFWLAVLSLCTACLQPLLSLASLVALLAAFTVHVAYAVFCCSASIADEILADVEQGKSSLGIVASASSSARTSHGGEDDIEAAWDNAYNSGIRGVWYSLI